MTWLMCVCLLTALHAAEPARAPVALVAQPPVIDGKLDDPCWEGLTPLTTFTHGDGTGASRSARLLIAQDAHGLYLAAKAFDDPASLLHPRMHATQHDAAALRDDESFEFSFDPEGDGHHLYRLAISLAGVNWDAFDTDGQLDTGWEPDYEFALHWADKFWTVELSLPWEAFNRSPNFGFEWGFGACHTRGRAKEKLCWAGVGGRLTNLGQFKPKAPAAAAPPPK